MIQPSTKVGHRLLWLSLAVVLWFVDQAVKYLVTQTMHLNSVLPIAPGFNWVYVLNPGAAFSFLADAGGWQRHLLSVFALVVSGVLVIWDNRSVLHSATGGYDGYDRLLHRTTIWDTVI